ncbi:hypothetical protein [Ornithinimicrobium panacihumi]|uniref:hypothetical protein n=1 Tax=Ornithinimicrobium panacihumi TaxID=2008449 RepID=UPI003F89C9EB
MAEPVSSLRRLAWRAVAALPGPVRELARLPVRLRADAELRALAPMPEADRRLYLGPLNTAGQAWAWARAAERHLPGTAAQNLWVPRTLEQAHFGYPADHTISVRARQGRVRQLHGERVLREASHVLFESGRPVLDNFVDGSMLDDQPVLAEAGIRSGVLWHGSEIRDLREHAARYPHSPFAAEWDDYFTLLQSIVDANRARLADVDGPVLVSTPDLLDVLPGATWLPLVVDVERFATAAGQAHPALGGERPVVLHAPSNPRLKGTAVVEEVLTRLDGEGVVEYRRLSGVPHDQMAGFVADADVVVDQIVLGNPGVLVAESWAAGRLVVAHLSDEVRRRMQEADPEGADVPVVEADPTSLEEVVREIAAHPESFRGTAESGVGWARRNHDGRRSAAVLDEALLSR